jgi:UDP-N-acetylglucosamine--N-acetylmuramyl-(pentapeptide) pyrophosphoryl-undecaprenol N-acetylglucosamine transferase
MKVLMVGGGTGGHITPALAVADVLKSTMPDMEIRFAGTASGIESNLVPDEGYELMTLPARGVTGTSGRARLSALVTLVRGTLRSIRALQSWRPDVVFSTGGYVAPPVCLAAWLRGIPIVIFEPNTIAGRANRILSRFATEIHLGNAMARTSLPCKEKVRLTGVPVRHQIHFGNRARAVRMYRLDPGRFTVLVLGGSQGAHAINGHVVDAIRELGSRDDIQFVLQSGPVDYESLLTEVRPLSIRTWVRPFIHQMGDALAVADLVIARAGALTLAEICVTGISSILIPYPHAADNHQVSNARYLEEVGAAKVFLSEEVSGPVLAQEISGLMKNYHELRSRGINAQKLSRLDAAEKVATRIAALAGAAWPAEERPRRRRRKRAGEEA